MNDIKPVFLCVLWAIMHFSPQVAAQKRYVHAIGGLDLYEKADSSASVVQHLIYGTLVSLLEPGNAPATPDPQDFQERMIPVSYLGKQGYIYDGYLSRIPGIPDSHPTQEALNNYLFRLHKENFEAFTSRCERNFGNSYEYEIQVSIADISWKEAFLLARKLYRIPEAFNFPDYVQQAELLVVNPEKRSLSTLDQLEASFDPKGKLLQIKYTYQGGGRTRMVYILPDKHPDSAHDTLTMSQIGISKK